MQGRKFLNRAKGKRKEVARQKCMIRHDNVYKVVNLLENNPTNPEINEKFYNAIINMDLQMISALLMNGIKIGALNNSKQTAVHVAFVSNHLQLVNEFLRHCDKKVNHTDDIGLSHFHIACITGLDRVVLEFIENGVDVNLRVGSNGLTPLQLAVKHAWPEVIKQLLRHSADASVTDEIGRTPLHLACGIHESIGDVILSKKFGSIVNKAKKITAIKQKTTRIVQQLIQSGSSVDARDRYGESPLFHVFRDDTHEYVARKFSRGSLDYRIYKDQFQRTKMALISSLRMGQHEKLKLLLSCKANVWIRSNETGDTILHRAIKDLEILRDPRYFGEPLFDDVAHTRMIQDVLKRGLSVNVKNRYGETALSIATSILSLNAANVLLNHGANSRDIRLDNGFRYPRLLPSLEAVHNFLEIVAMKRYSLSGEESLSVLRFLVDNNAECKYADPEDEDAASKLRNLLEFGTDENVINTMQRITMNDGYSKGIVNDQINKYLVKVRMNGMRLSKRVEDCLNRIIVWTDTPDIPYREIDQFKAESSRMRETKLASGRTLASILTAPPAEVFSFVKRGEHKEILYARYLEFSESFRHNWGIVKGFFAKFLIRSFVVKVFNEEIRFVTAKQLPDHCCERIAIYLSNEDLLRLCVANTVEVPRREMEARNLTDQLLSSLRVA